MNVLLAHNFYQQAGGEDQVFADEAQLLEAHGHKVARFTMDNDDVNAMGRLAAARKALWNDEARRALRQAIRQSGARVVHFHNTFPLISPAGYRAAHEEGAAVVQTLHNYRLMCVTATFCRDNRVCEDCLGRSVAWPGILHRCYRGSVAGSAVVAAMQSLHRLKGTWRREVDLYIALSAFGRMKFIEGGLPAEKIVVKPNFLQADPGPGTGGGGYALFAGRLAPEKGIATLLRAWPGVFAETGTRLKVAGDGPMKPEVERAAQGGGGIDYLGRVDFAGENYATLGAAKGLVLPSVWYEGQPKTVIEALATGTPIIASRLGSLPEMVAEGETGILFEAGNADDLAAKAAALLGPGRDLGSMRRAARQEFERLYTAEKNYPQLLACYEAALKRVK